MGKNTDKYNMSEILDKKITPEMITKLIKYWQRKHGLKPDGRCGENTRATLRPPIRVVTPPKWEEWDGPAIMQPTNRQGIYEVFGNPGNVKENKKWHRENIVGVRIPGVNRNRKIWLHKGVEPYFREAVRRVRSVDPLFTFHRVGGHVFRHIRHDPSRPLSTHSWGIAVDINPKENFAKSFKRREGPELWTKAYDAMWSPSAQTINENVVAAFSSCGFAWGSDWDEDGSAKDHTFYDAMHFEWVARDGNGWNV